jgi:hypothetical protein
MSKVMSIGPGGVAVPPPKVCIIGADGNMGRRYRAIFESEGLPYAAVDWDDPFPTGLYTHHIIATPTETHTELLMEVCARYKPPLKILVEKPFAKIRDMRELDIIRKAGYWGNEVYMVNQYAYYSHGITETSGQTSYDYYNSGKDGIGWDCIQLLHLARDGISHLRNKSPVWDCWINGTQLNRELIDLCYVKMILDFVSDGQQYGRRWGWDDIRHAHAKALKYEEDLNRCTGEERLNTPQG